MSANSAAAAAVSNLGVRSLILLFMLAYIEQRGTISTLIFLIFIIISLELFPIFLYFVGNLPWLKRTLLGRTSQRLCCERRREYFGKLWLRTRIHYFSLKKKPKSVATLKSFQEKHTDTYN